MDKQFDLLSSDDCEELNRLLNKFGVHIEHDLFDRPYVLIDYQTYKSGVIQTGGRPKKISKETRNKAIILKKKGMTVRDIAIRLGISIGSVSSITRDQ